MVELLLALAVLVALGAGYWTGRDHKIGKYEKELDRLRRVVMPEGQPTHRGPANMDAPPSRVTRGRFKYRKRWER